MSGYATSHWVRAMPPSPGHRATLAPTVMRMLKEAGYPPSPQTHLLDSHAGTGSLSRLAALIGYRVSANDLSPAHALALRWGLSGRTLTDHEVRRLQLTRPDPRIFSRSLATSMFTEPHERMLSRILTLKDSVRESDPSLSDALGVLTWRYALSLLPHGTLKPSQFTAMVRDGRFDAIPTSLDSALNAVLTTPDALLGNHLRRMAAGTLKPAYTTTASDFDAPSLIASLSDVDVLLLDNPSPGDNPYAVQSAMLSRLTTGDELQGESDRIVDGGLKPERIARAHAHARECLTAAAEIPCIVWIQADRAFGQITSPEGMRDTVRELMPFRTVRLHTYEVPRSPVRIHLAVIL